jgi:hypothetical protein
MLDELAARERGQGVEARRVLLHGTVTATGGEGEARVGWVWERLDAAVHTWGLGRAQQPHLSVRKPGRC